MWLLQLVVANYKGQTAMTTTCTHLLRTSFTILLIGASALGAEPQAKRGDSEAALKKRIEVEVPHTNGFMLATCYKLIQPDFCKSGYASGLDSSCSGNCIIGRRLEEYANSKRSFVFQSDVTIEGRLLDGNTKNAPLSGMVVKVYLPSGVPLTASTNNKGHFTIKFESVLTKSNKSLKPGHIDLGDLEFDPMIGTAEEQPYYFLAILPK